MSSPTMLQVTERLADLYPHALIMCWDRSEGYSIRCQSKDGNWSFERNRLASPAAAMMFAEAALSEFYGA